MIAFPVLAVAVALTVLTLWAIANDAYSYRIPNMVNAGLILLYPVALFATNAPLDWQDGLLAFAIIFAVGFALFIANIMGGGDVKMLAALALWLEYGVNLWHFLMIMALLGGILTLILLAIRKYMPFFLITSGKPNATIPRLFSHGEPVPYGIAIGITFLWMLWAGDLSLMPAIV
jgi:prepilin peptidase CpaA